MDIIINIGLTIISALLTINIFLLQMILKKINDCSKAQIEFEHRITILETKTK